MKMNYFDLFERKTKKKFHDNVRRNVVYSLYIHFFQHIHNQLLSSIQSSAGKSSEAANQQKLVGEQ